MKTRTFSSATSVTATAALPTALVPLKRLVLSGTPATWDLADIFDATYDTYLVRGYNIGGSYGSVDFLYMAPLGPIAPAGSEIWWQANGWNNSTTTTTLAAAGSGVRLSIGLLAPSGMSANFDMTVRNAANAARRTHWYGSFWNRNTGSGTSFEQGIHSATWAAPRLMTGFRLWWGNGTIRASHADDGDAVVEVFGQRGPS